MSVHQYVGESDYEQQQPPPPLGSSQQPRHAPPSDRQVPSTDDYRGPLDMQDSGGTRQQPRGNQNVPISCVLNRDSWFRSAYRDTCVAFIATRAQPCYGNTRTCQCVGGVLLRLNLSDTDSWGLNR